MLPGCGFLGLIEELSRLCFEFVVFDRGFPCSVWHGVLWCFEMLFEMDFEMVFQKSFGKEMHQFCKGFGKCLSVFSVCGETKRL